MIDQPLDFAAIQSQIAASADQDQYTVATTPFHTHGGTDSSTLDFRDLTNRTRFIAYRLLDPVYPVYVGSAVGGYIVMPFSGSFGIPNITGGNLVNPETLNGTISCYAAVDVAGTTNNTLVDILISGSTSSARTSIFTSARHMNILSGFTSSLITAQQPTIDLGAGQNAFNAGDRISFDVLSVSSTPPLGLTIYLRVTETSP